jgi:hypothetical protein
MRALILRRRKPEPVPDYRFLGPTHECPRCQSIVFTTVVQLDPDTLEIAAYGLDVQCAGCSALVKLACPIDPPVVRELPGTEDVDY